MHWRVRAVCECAEITKKKTIFGSGLSSHTLAHTHTIRYTQHSPAYVHIFDSQLSRLKTSRLAASEFRHFRVQRDTDTIDRVKP